MYYKKLANRRRIDMISFAEILRKAMSDSPLSSSLKYDLESYSHGVERIELRQ